MGKFEIEVAVCSFLVIIIVLCIRLIFALPSLKHHQIKTSPLKSIEDKNVMVLLGSGGHTGEMIRILSGSNTIPKVHNLHFITSSGDSTSLIHLKKFINETNIETKTESLELPRARKVGEGFVSSIISTVKSILFTFIQFSKLKIKPDVLIVNGPGTSVPICYYFFLLKFLGIGKTKIIYIESLARVNDLSLSGKLCYLISDRFIVQWNKLQKRYPNSECYGIMV
ncbi:UDP-N-acetylglucosamine transferase subunit [Wickerhamomyces ciferrii]|uniref:UDP-N-acetylglucosamine transferase subunit ALG14 n=1 Tax=Wickerhamomyces ciferrii (strain ATCC 14091 / BCRC 22168 / CBS 111 / JCM 3599 / NBRC 0793 / NRRL Y-1031 F-60-10) TaxID=1206466 RepID=K0KKB3_WICCF|nr:UDP-N-acetylglucosamine transferase subunit [Wickerhamomyces ciferrii]CCH41904.1 UDP-N-acetylglucosamine transferase subunit [Wickerhamomyces ciferrii]